MVSVGWTAEAVASLDAIRSYIGLFNPDAADRITQKLIDAANSLSSFPSRGRPVEGALRELATVPPYVIRYRVEGEMVVITRIRHGRQLG